MRWRFCSQDSEAWCSYKDGNNDTLYWGAAYLDTRLDAYYYKYSHKPEDSQVVPKTSSETVIQRNVFQIEFEVSLRPSKHLQPGKEILLEFSLRAKNPYVLWQPIAKTSTTVIVRTVIKVFIIM